MAIEAQRKRFLIIANPSAGRKNARLVARVAETLARKAARVDLVETKTAEAARSALLSASDNNDAVVAAGGDGTIRALASMLGEMDSSLPLGVIPAGTGNVLANELGLPSNPVSLAELLLNGSTRAVRLMTANGAPFLLMASAGFDANVVRHLSVSIKQRVGRSAYALPTIRALLHRPPQPFELLLDAKPHAATWAIISNARSYGGSFRLAPKASIFDDQLFAVLFGARTRLGRLKELLALATGRLEQCPSVHIVPCKHGLIRTPKHQPTQADGDALGFGPVEIKASEHVVSLIAPDSAR